MNAWFDLVREVGVPAPPSGRPSPGANMAPASQDRAMAPPISDGASVDISKPTEITPTRKAVVVGSVVGAMILLAFLTRRGSKA